MIISTLNIHAKNGEVEVDLYRTAKSDEPFIIRLASCNTIHITAADARLLQVQLASAIYEYETTYEYKETE